MTIAKQMDIRAHIKDYFDLAFSGEAVKKETEKPVVEWNKNVVVISEKEYNELQKARRNEEYLKKLDTSFEQVKSGNTISFTMEELKEMESDNWTPSKKITDFLEK